MDIDKRINISNRIYPVFFGLSADLVFFIAINTIFLTKVKHLSAAQISSLTMFSMLFTILISRLVIRIIKRIGNIRSIKLGIWMLLIAALFITFSNSYFFILIGYIFYNSAPLFKCMDSVVLRENLKYQNRLPNYIQIQNKATLIYSLVTMIIAFISGFLFNINPYLPMFICIGFCLLNCVLVQFIYEVKCDQQEELKIHDLKFTKKILLILVVYALLYSSLELTQVNTKIFLQYNMEEFLALDRVVIILSIIISLSRIARVLGNYLFMKTYKKLNKEVPRIMVTLLIFSIFLILFGGAIKKGFIGIILTSLGFLILLGIRDPYQNYMRTMLLNKCRAIYHDQAIVYFEEFRKISNFFISTMITLILLKFELVYALTFLLVIVVISTVLVRRMYDLVK